MKESGDSVTPRTRKPADEDEKGDEEGDGRDKKESKDKKKDGS